MGLEQYEIEGEAAAIRDAAGVDRNEAIAMPALARRLFGRGAVRVVADLAAGGARLRVEGGRERIVVPAGLTDRELAATVAHELGEWRCLRAGYTGDDIEGVASAIGAALLLPRVPFVREVRRLGFAVRELGDAFVAPDAIVALRVGEVGEGAVALVTERWVLRRDAHLELPRDGALFEAALQGGGARFECVRCRRPEPTVALRLRDAG